MKIKFDFSRLFILALLFLILCGGAVSANGQADCARTRNDLRITGLLNKQIKKLKADNPRKHIDIVVLVRKNTVTIVNNRTPRVFVNQIVQAAKGHGHKSVINTGPCINVEECRKGTKPCGGGGDCIPCDCPCSPWKKQKGRAAAPVTKRVDTRKNPSIRR
jgi:hypothetical protein